MAATAEGTRLTRQHQQLQLQLRARAISDWTKLWPIWDGSEDRFKQLAAASIPLVQNYHRMSAGISVDYYKRLRSVEVDKSKGTVDIDLPELEPGQIAGTLYLTGRDMTDRALKAGHSPEAAMQNALVRTAGSLTRLILNGGRDALVQVSIADGSALGYRRITTGTCDFCRELAEKGITSNPDFQSHDHCGCVAEPAFAKLARSIPIIGDHLKDTKSVLDAEDGRAKGKSPESGGGGGGDGNQGPKLAPAGGDPPREVPGDQFHQAFTAARENLDRKAWLTPYSVEEFNQMQCFFTHEGRVGGALKPAGEHLEAVSLYNNGGPPGSGRQMLQHLIDQGADQLDCIGDPLRDLYRGQGFEVVETLEWDDAFAPEGWNYERDGRPNIYVMNLRR